MRKKRSVLSIVVAVVMTIAMMPASAFASTNLDGMTEMQKEAVPVVIFHYLKKMKKWLFLLT